MSIHSAADKSLRKPRGRPFPKGRSGNPKGKPPGTRSRATLIAETMLDGQVEGLVQKTIELALAGDLAALKLCLERIAPPRRDRAVTMDAPKLDSAADVPAALGAVFSAVARGEITPAEGAAMASVVEKARAAFEIIDLDRRISDLEAASAADGQ